MKTPIYTFLKGYANEAPARFHMPGHKGRTVIGPESIDLTEVDGADVLYHENGIILESETIASGIFHTGRTFYSTEGSTLAIKAMLFAVSRGVRKTNRRILAARNVHKAFVYGCALLDLDVEWLFSESGDTHYLTSRVTAEQVESVLRNDANFCAVYITSPDYLGATSDVEAIARACHKYQVPLLVDNAHGAYLAFLQPSRHPIALGADLCADSAHKTLPVLTGGAYLHVSKTAPEGLIKNAEDGLRLFASTSPSYLTLASLDKCNEYLGDDGACMRAALSKIVSRVESLLATCRELGLPVIPSDEPLKLCLSLFASDLGRFREILNAHRVVPEMCDNGVVVFMFSTETQDKDFGMLQAALKALAEKPLKAPPVPMRGSCEPTVALCIRDAMMLSAETVKVRDALGRICALPSVSCPPAVPIVISGEVITQEVVDALLFYGYEEIDVVKK